MARTKRINNKLGPRALKKKKNPFLNRSGGFNLIDRFPAYDKKKDKKSKK